MRPLIIQVNVFNIYLRSSASSGPPVRARPSFAGNRTNAPAPAPASARSLPLGHSILRSRVRRGNRPYLIPPRTANRRTDADKRRVTQRDANFRRVTWCRADRDRVETVNRLGIDLGLPVIDLGLKYQCLFEYLRWPTAVVLTIRCHRDRHKEHQRN